MPFHDITSPDRQHPLLRGALGSVPIGAETDEAAHQQRGEELKTGRHADHHAIYAQLLMHIEQNHRQRQAGGQVGSEEQASGKAEAARGSFAVVVIPNGTP